MASQASGWSTALNTAIVIAANATTMAIVGMYPFARRGRMEQVHRDGEEHCHMDFVPLMNGLGSNRPDLYRRNIQELHAFSKRIATRSALGRDCEGETLPKNSSRSKIVEYREWPTSVHYLGDWLFGSGRSFACLEMTATYEDGKLITDVYKDDTNLLMDVIERHEQASEARL